MDYSTAPGFNTFEWSGSRSLLPRLPDWGPLPAGAAGATKVWKSQVTAIALVCTMGQHARC